MATKKTAPKPRGKPAAKPAKKKPAAGKAAGKKAVVGKAVVKKATRPVVPVNKAGKTKVAKAGPAAKKSGRAAKPAPAAKKPGKPTAAKAAAVVKAPKAASLVKSPKKAKPAIQVKPPKKAKPAEKAAKPVGKAGAKAAPKATPPRPEPSKPEVAKLEPKPEPKVVEAPKPRPTIFSVGDKVVHPQHGAAVIAKRIKQEVAGKVKDYFLLDIATDQLKVFVPVEKIDEVIRPVISKNQTRMVFSKFREEPQEAGSNWSRWYKVLNEKMTSGDIYQVAEVVRDLTYAQQTKGISPALKRMLSRARLTLISEIRFALDIDEEEATRRLDKALPKVENPVPLPV